MKTEEYYKYLKDENYKALLNSEMQLDSARQRAMKNSQTQLAAQGMASSGYGSTMQTGLEGQYLQGLQNAQQVYQENQTNLNIQEQAQLDKDMANKYSSLSQLMGSAQSRDELNNLLSTQGYGSYQNGKFVWNQDALSKLGEDNALNLQSLYGMYGSQLDSVAELAYAQEWSGLMDAFVQRAEAGAFTSKEQLDKWVNTWIDTSKMTAEQKKKWDATYKEYADAISKQETANWKNEVTTQSANGQITTNFDSDTAAKGTDLVEISLGGYTYDLSWDKKAPSQSAANSHQKGEIWIDWDSSGQYMIPYIKSNDGKVYYAGLTNYDDDSNQQFLSDLAKAFGYQVVSGNGNVFVVIDGENIPLVM